MKLYKQGDIIVEDKTYTSQELLLLAKIKVELEKTGNELKFYNKEDFSSRLFNWENIELSNFGIKNYVARGG